MKKTFILVLTLIVLGFAVPVYAAKPADTCATIKDGTITDSTGAPLAVGFDKWGYNYQAHLFEGWYDNYSRPAQPATGGMLLSMKWNDAWLSNKDCNNDHKLDRAYNNGGSYIGSGAWLTNHITGTYGAWNVTGHYTWTVMGTYVHDIDLVQTPDGNITGTGGYPAGGPYLTTEKITGKLDGNLLTLTTTYDGPYNAGYTVTFIGDINSLDNSISGTLPWTWTFEGKAQKLSCTWTDFVKMVAAPSDANKVDGIWYSKDGIEIGPDIWGEFAIIQEETENPCGVNIGLSNYQSQLRSGLGNW